MAETAGQQFAKMPSSSKVLLLALLLVLLGVGYYSLWHGPLTEQIEGAAARKGQLEQQLQEAQGLQRKFVKLREELEARKLSDQQNLRILPPDAETATTLAELNRIAELSGLQIQSVEPRPETASQFYYRIPVTLVLSGRYHQLAKFFHNVSRLQRAINMENITLGEPQMRGENLVLHVNVLATSFRRKDV
jgi:type IV pilus assembly protein PilO